MYAQADYAQRARERRFDMAAPLPVLWLWRGRIQTAPSCPLCPISLGVHLPRPNRRGSYAVSYQHLCCGNGAAMSNRRSSPRCVQPAISSGRTPAVSSRCGCCVVYNQHLCGVCGAAVYIRVFTPVVRTVFDAHNDVNNYGSLCPY